MDTLLLSAMLVYLFDNVNKILAEHRMNFGGQTGPAEGKTRWLWANSGANVISGIWGKPIPY